MDFSGADQDVLQFVLDHVESVPHLEALLLIWQNPAAAWSCELLASRIYVAPMQGRVILEDLRRLGVLRSADSRTYMYEPAWDERRALLPRLADLYRRQLIQVTKLIHSKGSSSVREFARAFQIKKE